MDPTPRVGRRRFLSVLASASVVGVTGCLGGDGGGNDGEPTLDVEPDYKGWFKGVSNYHRTVDRREQATTTVRVGTSANNGRFGFGPAAVAISPETTVTWDWTGEGGVHNVVAESGTFDSGRAVQGADRTFEFTADQPSLYRYVCEPHRSVGMRGALFVALE